MLWQHCHEISILKEALQTFEKLHCVKNNFNSYQTCLNVMCSGHESQTLKKT